MTYYTYFITIEKEGDAFYGYSSDFPGVYGIGKTIEEAKRSVLEAMQIYIEDCKEKGKEIPQSKTVHTETVSIVVR